MEDFRTVKRPSGAAFLLSQVGAQVSKRLAQRLAALDLTPAHIGVLGVVGQTPDIDQRELARRLGVVPSRVVTLVDQLEDKGILVRQRSTTDRRQYRLRIAETADLQRRSVMMAISEHDTEVTAALSKDEVATLVRLLSKLASAEGLLPEQHPNEEGEVGGDATKQRGGPA